MDFRGVVLVRQRLSSTLDQQGQSDAVAVDVRDGADRGGAEGGEVEEGGGRGLRGIVPVRQRLSSALDQLGQSDAVAVDVREGADRGGAEGGEVEDGWGRRRSWTSRSRACSTTTLKRARPTRSE